MDWWPRFGIGRLSYNGTSVQIQRHQDHPSFIGSGGGGVSARLVGAKKCSDRAHGN